MRVSKRLQHKASSGGQVLLAFLFPAEQTCDEEHYCSLHSITMCKCWKLLSIFHKPIYSVGQHSIQVFFRAQDVCAGVSVLGRHSRLILINFKFRASRYFFSPLIFGVPTRGKNWSIDVSCCHFVIFLLLFLNFTHYVPILNLLLDLIAYVGRVKHMGDIPGLGGFFVSP